MRRSFVAIAAAWVLALGGCVSPPTDISVETYEVSGTSVEALERSLAMRGPIVPGVAGHAFAAVETTFLHSYEPVKGQRICYFGPGQVGLRSEVTLPKWRDRESAPPDLRDKWDVLSRYAIIHESGHIRISQSFARRLDAAYRRSRAPDCAVLDSGIAHAVEPIAAAHVRSQTYFDTTDPTRFRRYLRRNGYGYGG